MLHNKISYQTIAAFAKSGCYFSILACFLLMLQLLNYYIKTTFLLWPILALIFWLFAQYYSFRLFIDTQLFNILAQTTTEQELTCFDQTLSFILKNKVNETTQTRSICSRWQGTKKLLILAGMMLFCQFSCLLLSILID